jgi:exo-1,4-beta-D-glucosaminidase
MVGIREACSHFGIRRIIQNRDLNEQFPEAGKGSNFYLQRHGQDLRARGADYTSGLFNR